MIYKDIQINDSRITLSFIQYEYKRRQIEFLLTAEKRHIKNEKFRKRH